MVTFPRMGDRLLRRYKRSRPGGGCHRAQRCFVDGLPTWRSVLMRAVTATSASFSFFGIWHHQILWARLLACPSKFPMMKPRSFLSLVEEFSLLWDVSCTDYSNTTWKVQCGSRSQKRSRHGTRSLAHAHSVSVAVPIIKGQTCSGCQIFKHPIPGCPTLGCGMSCFRETIIYLD